MNITRAAIEKNRITIVALIVIAAAGFQAYFSLPRSEDPGFTVRTAQVRTVFPGASPERVELLVTDKLEKVIQEMPEIDFINSTSKTGVSIIMVNIMESYTTMRPIWDDLRRKVERARGDLPPDVRGPFVNDEFGDVFGTIVAITGDGFSYAELKEIADQCRNELLLSDNIAKVDIDGIQQERVYVEFDNSRLAELGLSTFQLKTILEARNIIISGGVIYTDEERIAIEPSGNFDSVEELRRTVIKVPGSETVIYLEDIANIYRGYIDPPQALMRINGVPGLAMAISLREGGNILDLGQEVMAAVERFQQAYPIGVEFDVVAFQPFYVEKKVNEFVISLLQAIVIVLIVMLLFLGVRTGLVVASLIPMAMISAILLMSVFDIGLNQMSLASLIIALGMLVDNAIVMSESIMVSMSEGKSRLQAAVESARELRVPLLISSLTTAAAFLPIFLAESTTGEYTAPLFKVVTITLLASWVLSLTMTPMFCVNFLKVKKRPAAGSSYDTRFYRSYRSFLIWLLKHRPVTIGSAALLFVLAIVGLGFVPNIFFPPNEKPILYAELELPVGSPLKKTSHTVGRVERFLQDSLLADTAEGIGGVLSWSSYIGEGAPRYILSYNPQPPSPEYAYLIINGTDKETMTETVAPRLRDYCFRTFPDLDVTVRELPLGPPVDNPVEVRISGTDADRIFEIVDEVKTHMEAVPGLRTVTDNWGMWTKKIVVNINQPRAQRAGLTSQDIAVSLQTIFSGIQLSSYREEDEVLPIVLRSVAADRKDFGKLESHDIYVQATGRSVPLKQVADIDVVWEPSKILRRDRLKTVTVQSQITENANAIALALELDEWLNEVSADWEVGYKYELGGELETSGEANESIMVKLPIAGLIIVLLLVGQFNSIRKPIIILLTIPLGLIGVTIGLLVTGSYMGFMTFLGVISLAGIVINNAIVLIDRISIEKTDFNRSDQDAIVEAGQRRLRPILLTAMTTVGGLLPLWIGGSPMFIPMAIAIIFGLVFATVLTLGFVPTLYSLFYRISFGEYDYSRSPKS